MIFDRNILIEFHPNLRRCQATKALKFLIQTYLLRPIQRILIVIGGIDREIGEILN